MDYNETPTKGFIMTRLTKDEIKTVLKIAVPFWITAALVGAISGFVQEIKNPS